MDVKLTPGQKREVYGRLPEGGLSGAHFYENKLWTRTSPVSGSKTKELEVMAATPAA